MSPAPTPTPAAGASGVDVDQIVRDARVLADDSLRGRGPWTPENERAARIIAARLAALSAKPLVGTSLLVPFVSERRPNDTVYNVAGVIGNSAGRLIGITAHLDHLGVGAPDSTGDAIYNGFLDDAIGVAMSLDVARRYGQAPGARGLVVMFFNLEEQGLLGSKAFVERADVQPILRRLDLLIGIDAGSPSGEALDWQLMGGLPEHNGTRLADSIAQSRGWSTVSSPPRAISDVFPFSQRGVPILFPIPGQRWRGYTANERNALMRRFDHYHNPADEYDPAFPLEGTRQFADWLYAIVKQASSWP
jgi:Zn-dependent M28 family amino/carboxypeptidase